MRGGDAGDGSRSPSFASVVLVYSCCHLSVRFPRQNRRRMVVIGSRDASGEESRIADSDEEARAHDRALRGAEGNAHLTRLSALALLVLLAAEGVTLLKIHKLITLHVFIGMLLVPPVVVKIGSTGWRFARYYRGNPAYRRKGPPPVLLRLLGPVVVLLTVVVLGSGIALLVVPHSFGRQMLFIHKASFVLWFGAMAIHVLGHIVETAQMAPADLARRTRRQVRGAGARTWTVAGSLVVGVILGVVMLPSVGHWLAGGGFQVGR
jgi:hypothetical protein